MSRPEQRQRAPRVLGAVGLGLVAVGVVTLAVTLVLLDARRRKEIETLTARLDSLRLQVDDVLRQLEHQGQLINTTLQVKNTPKREPAEEVVYEDEYEYDDEEASYEYDEEEEQNTKATVKRTAVLSERNSTQISKPEFARTRRKRDVRGQGVPVHEESITGSTENYNRPPQHHHKTSGPSPMYQERPQESVVRLRHMSHSRSMDLSGRDSLQNSREYLQPQSLEGQRQQLLAAHFIGDASKYSQRNDYHYYGNNILYHPHGLFKDWVPSSWMFDLGTASKFPIENGKLIIQQQGIYFVYAQIYYAATHDRCGFHIKHNEKEVAQCMTMTSGRSVKRNTCFTGLVLHLRKDDLLWISEVEGYRNTSFKGSHSFFGLIQLKTM